MKKILIIFVLFVVGCNQQDSQSFWDTFKTISQAADAGLAGADPDYSKAKLRAAQAEWYKQKASQPVCPDDWAQQWEEFLIIQDMQHWELMDKMDD